MKDYLVKALAFNNEARVYIACTTDLVNMANMNQGCYPTAAVVLGQTLTVTAMMGAMLKGEESVTVRLNPMGPIGLVVADANAYGEVRGYASNPRIHFQHDSGKLATQMALGNGGELFVTKDLGLKDYFTGQTIFTKGDISDAFTNYFAQSEQIPSAISLGVLVNEENVVTAAGGIIIQLMPNASEETIVKIEKALATISPVSEMVALNMTPDEMLRQITNQNDDFKLLETQSLTFKCKCSKEKFETGIVSLGNDEIDSMINEDNGAEVVCHFCMEKYQFSATDLEVLKS